MAGSAPPASLIAPLWPDCHAAALAIVRPAHLPLWQAAAPYLDTRCNDRHTLYCYAFAENLLYAHPDADPAIVLPALLLHDVGWSSVPADKQLLSFGPHMRYPQLRRRHEVEGARIAAEILIAHATPAAVVAAITTIIDGHDTRAEPFSLHDALVKDADKLWRYTPFGVETLRGWFGYSLTEQFALLARWLETRFFTETAVLLARTLFTSLQLSYPP